MNNLGMLRGLVSWLAAALLVVSSTQASQVTYSINANGAKEVTAGGTPNQGDLDGSATGTLVLDNGTGAGTTGSATFSLTLSNIDTTTLSGHHIHIGAANTTGTIVLSFGDPDTIRTGNVLSGTVTGLSATQITTIFGNPSGFYYNLHNDAFSGGAVRDQLVPVPEAGSFSMLLGGMAAVWSIRRRKATFAP